MRTSFTLFVLSCCLMQGCSPVKLLEDGNAPRAYTVSKKRVEQGLNQKKPLKDADVEALRTSYAVLQDEQIRRIETIETIGAPDRHLELYPIYQQLLTRRVEIEPFLPVLHNLDPRYDIPSLEALTERSRQRAGSFCYDEAAKLFPEARAGDKPAARTAFYWLEKSLAYVPESLEYKNLKEEMMDIGTIRVLVAPDESLTYNAQKLTQYTFLRQNAERKQWLEIYFSRPDSRIDYLLLTEIAQVNVGANEETSNRTEYYNEVINGYQRREKNAIYGDSTNIVSEDVPIYTTVQGTIWSVEQYRAARASLNLYLTSPDGELVVAEWQIARTAEWSNRYEVCSGDIRALPRSCTGSKTRYPSDPDMLGQLAWPLRSALLQDVVDLFPETSAELVAFRK